MFVTLTFSISKIQRNSRQYFSSILINHLSAIQCLSQLLLFSLSIPQKDVVKLNKQLLTKYIINGSIFFLYVLGLDFVIELFQINESSTVVTLLGIKIITHMTSSELTTAIGLTPKVLISYLTILSIWLIITNVRFKKHRL